MKHPHRYLLSLLAAALLLCSCARTGSEAATTTAPTEETSRTDAQSATQTTTAAPIPTVVEKYLPMPFVDIEFYDDGTARDAMGNMSLTMPDTELGRVENSQVTIDGKTYTLPHLYVEKKNGMAVLRHKALSSEAELQALLRDGFTIEAYLVNGNRLSADSTEQCMTTTGQAGGFGFSVYKGKYTFGVYTGDSWRRTGLGTAYDTTSLTHLLGVYDADMGQILLYVNGKPVDTAAAPGDFRPAQNGCWERINLGADTSPSGNGTELHATKTRIADYKLYPTAMTADQAALAYDAANAALSGRDTDYELIYKDADEIPGHEVAPLFDNLAASYADVYEPTTGLVSAPTLWQTATGDLSALSAATERPATVLLGVTLTDGALHATAPDGRDLGLLYDCIAALDGKIIPAFELKDTSTASSLITLINRARLADCFVLSADAALLRTVSDATAAARTVLDRRDATPDAAKLFLEASACGTKAVLLDASTLTQQEVLAMQARSLSVFAQVKPGKAALHSAIFAGVTGILTDDSAGALAYYKSISDTTVNAPTLMVAHRGDYQNCPDNTLRSLIAAAQSGASATEFDVWLTADGHLVLNHDSKMTYWSEQLACTTSTRAQLKALRCTDKRSDGTEEVAFYDEVMHYFSQNDTHMIFTVEIKDARQEVVDKLYSITKEYGMLDRVLFICMNADIDRYAYETYGVGVQDNLSTNFPKDDIRLALAQSCLDLSALPTSYYIQWSDFSEPLCRMLRHRGIKYSPWTTSNAPDNDLHYSYGVTEFTTNVPHHSDRYIRFLKVEEGTDGGITVRAVYYDGHTEDVTDSARFVPIEGHVSYGGGKVSGSGSYAFRLNTSLPLLKKYTYTLYSQSVTR